MLSKLFVTISIALALGSSFAIAETVNMFAGIRRGGFGDIASNILMAQKLKELSPGLTINMWVGSDVLDHVSTLIPEFDAAKGVQVIKGITFYYGEKNPMPPGDYFFGFSLAKKVEHAASNYAPGFYVKEHHESVVNVYDLIYRVANAGVIVYFKEYDGSAHAITSVINVAGGLRTFTVETGFKAAGVYVSPTKPQLAPTKGDALKMLLAEGYELPAAVTSKTRLGFSYSAEVDPANLYIESMRHYATARSGESFVLVVKDFNHLEARNLPANLHVVRLRKKTPFELNKTLIAASDMPILVTGDVSKTLAIEHEKVFMYETNTWKQKSIVAMTEKMAASSEYFRSESNAAKLSAVLGIPVIIKDEVAPALARKLAQTFNDPSFEREFSSALAEMRKTTSLPLFALNFVKLGTELAQTGESLQTSKKSAVTNYLGAKGVSIEPGLFSRFGSYCSGLLTRAKAIF